MTEHKNSKSIQNQIDQIRWFHEFDFGGGLKAVSREPDVEDHRRIWQFIEQQIDKVDLHGKTVGIIGTGKIGRLSAQIFKGFGTKVVAFDRHPDSEWAKSHGVEYLDLASVLAQSDVVSLHVPLVPDTFRLLNDVTIAQMKPGVFIVNTSRGKLIDTLALIAALKSGHIGGVALDVYEEEEGVFFEDLSGQILQDDELSRLLTFPNVLITAHQAFLTREALSEIARVSVANIKRFAAALPFIEGTVL